MMRILVTIFFTWIVLGANAQEWERVNGFPTTDCYGLYANGDYLYAGGPNRTYTFNAYTDYVIESSPLFLSEHGIESFSVHEGRLYAASYGRGVFTSTNQGETWQADNNGLAGVALYGAHLTRSPEGLFLATLGDGIYKRGVNKWERFSNGIPMNVSSNVFALRWMNNRLIAGAGGNGFVYILPDGTQNWQERNVRMPIYPGCNVYDFTLSGTKIIAATSGNLFTSTDGGNSWTADANNAIKGMYGSIATGYGYTFLVVNYGYNQVAIYRRSVDAPVGSSWEMLVNWTNCTAYKLVLWGNYLYVGRADGLYRLQVQGTTQIPDEEFMTLNTYPNPFTTQLNITLNEMPKPGNTFVVSDLNGRVVMQRTLHAQQTTIETDGWATGVYVYTFMQAGKAVHGKIIKH